MRCRHIQISAALVTALTVTGCGLANPYASTRPETSRPAKPITVTNANPVPERGGTIPQLAKRAQTALAPGAQAPTPQAALERYARLYTNWTATNIAEAQRRLAGISLGGARAQALQAAASYVHDTTLLHSHVANNGTVVAITRGRGPAAGDWVVVTRETTEGQGNYQGLPPQLHITYAHLTHTAAGWVVSTWSPQA